MILLTAFGLIGAAVSAIVWLVAMVFFTRQCAECALWRHWPAVAESAIAAIVSLFLAAGCAAAVYVLAM